MDTPGAALFSRTRGGLAVEPHGARAMAIVVALLLRTFWLVWFTGGRLAVYAVSDAPASKWTAPMRVQMPVGGRVVSTTLTMGRRVRAGETLVELDVQAQSFGVGEERARLSGLGPQIARVEAEIDEQSGSRRDEQGASAAAAQKRRPSTTKRGSGGPGGRLGGSE